MSELVAVMDLDLTIRWANRAAREIARESPIIGRRCYEVWNQRTTQCPHCPVDVTFREKRENKGTVQTYDGRVWEIWTTPIFDDNGDLESILEITKEISELKEQQKTLPTGSSGTVRMVRSSI